MLARLICRLPDAVAFDCTKLNVSMNGDARDTVAPYSNSAKRTKERVMRGPHKDEADRLREAGELLDIAMSCGVTRGIKIDRTGPRPMDPADTLGHDWMMLWFAHDEYP